MTNKKSYYVLKLTIFFQSYHVCPLKLTPKKNQAKKKRPDFIFFFHKKIRQKKKRPDFKNQAKK